MCFRTPRPHQRHRSHPRWRDCWIVGRSIRSRFQARPVGGPARRGAGEWKAEVIPRFSLAEKSPEQRARCIEESMEWNSVSPRVAILSTTSVSLRDLIIDAFWPEAHPTLISLTVRRPIAGFLRRQRAVVGRAYCRKLVQATWRARLGAGASSSPRSCRTRRARRTRHGHGGGLGARRTKSGRARLERRLHHDLILIGHDDASERCGRSARADRAAGRR